MPGRPGGRRGTGLAGPACCFALVLVLHSLLLVPRWSAGPRAIDGAARHRDAAARVRWLVPAQSIGPAPLPAAAPMATGLRSPQVSKVAPEGRPLRSALPEGLVLIPFPDAPMPGTRLTLRVLVTLGADGRPADVSSNAGPDIATAFVEAIQRGLRDVAFGPEQLGGHAGPAALCLTVSFDARQPQAEVRLDTAGLPEPSHCLAVPVSIES